MSDTLAIDDPEALERAVTALGDGRLLVVPTDTVYAVVADAFSPQATRRLLRVRGSGRNRPLPVLIGRPRQLSALAAEVPEVAERLAAEHWPGPLTLVLRAMTGMSWDLGNTGGTVSVRLPDEPFLQQLINEVGPLAGTGATRRGREAATTADAARAHFGDGVALYLDGGTREGERSTIVDVSRGEVVTFLRQGALPESDVLAATGQLPEPGAAAPGGDAGAAGPGADEASPDDASPDDASPDEASPDEASPDEASPDEASPDEASPDHADAGAGPETTDDSAAALEADEEDR